MFWRQQEQQQQEQQQQSFFKDLWAELAVKKTGTIVKDIFKYSNFSCLRS